MIGNPRNSARRSSFLFFPCLDPHLLFGPRPWTDDEKEQLWRVYQKAKPVGGQRHQLPLSPGIFFLKTPSRVKAAGSRVPSSIPRGMFSQTTTSIKERAEKTGGHPRAERQSKVGRPS